MLLHKHSLTDTYACTYMPDCWPWEDRERASFAALYPGYLSQCLAHNAHQMFTAGMNTCIHMYVQTRVFLHGMCICEKPHIRSTVHTHTHPLAGTSLSSKAEVMLVRSQTTELPGMGPSWTLRPARGEVLGDTALRAGVRLLGSETCTSHVPLILAEVGGGVRCSTDTPHHPTGPQCPEGLSYISLSCLPPFTPRHSAVFLFHFPTFSSPPALHSLSYPSVFPLPFLNALISPIRFFLYHLCPPHSGAASSPPPFPLPDRCL